VVQKVNNSSFPKLSKRYLKLTNNQLYINSGTKEQKKNALAFNLSEISCAYIAEGIEVTCLRIF